MIPNCRECGEIGFYEQGEDSYWAGEDEDGYELEIMTSVRDAVWHLARLAGEHQQKNGQKHEVSLRASPSCAEEARKYAEQADDNPFSKPV